MTKIAVLKGTSGTGKGTRVVQLVEFLKTKYKHKTRQYNWANKKRPLATVFPELKLAFIGCVVTSNKSGLASWTSMDQIHATVKNVENVPAILQPLFDEGYTLVCEGEPMMQSNRWRPQYLVDTFGVTDMYFQYFHYAGDREAYDKRIIGRSGKAAGESGWHREKNYETEHIKVNSEFTALGFSQSVCPVSGETGLWESKEGDSFNMLDRYDQPVHVWGTVFLSWVGLSALQGDFVSYAEKKPMLREINGANPLAKTKRLW